MKRTVAFITVLAFLLSGCGFYLKGSRPLQLQGTKIFLKSHGANAITAEIRQQPGIQEVPLATDPKHADFIVTLSDERFDRRILSVDPRTGKWREFELSYEVDFAVNRPDGAPLAKRDTIQISRDLAFDETAVISKFEEENLVRGEMMKDAAETVLRHVERVKVR